MGFFSTAPAINRDGYYEDLDAAEGMKGDRAGWVGFFSWLRGNFFAGQGGFSRAGCRPAGKLDAERWEKPFSAGVPGDIKQAVKPFCPPPGTETAAKWETDCSRPYKQEVLPTGAASNTRRPST